MSIRIVPKEKLDADGRKNNTAGAIPPLLFANIKTLYQHRSARMTTLAQQHPFAEYLNFAAQLAQAQHHAQHDHPLPQRERQWVRDNAALDSTPPLAVKTQVRSTHWHQLLHAIIAELRPDMHEPISSVLDSLEKASATELEQYADALLHYDFASVGSDKAPFLWAALSLYWVQLAAELPKHAIAEYGEQRQCCPVCQSVPVSGVIQLGTAQGLRYLHCALCESEWHVVRVKCSQCEQTGKLDYWSLDSEHAAIKAESCGECGSYLKLLYQEKDPHSEAVADDLASLFLDAKMEEEGFIRSSLNPLVFPQGE